MDLTLMFVVRAVDAVVQRVVFRRSGGNVDGESSAREDEERKRWRQGVTTRIDALLFWASSARSVVALRPSWRLFVFMPTINEE